jgi:hypothetical protein
LRSWGNPADINPITGEFFGQGYGFQIDKDGDKVVRIWEGKPVAKGQCHLY